MGISGEGRSDEGQRVRENRLGEVLVIDMRNKLEPVLVID
jgi:hypothetical protein